MTVCNLITMQSYPLLRKIDGVVHIGSGGADLRYVVLQIWISVYIKVVHIRSGGADSR